MQLCISRGDIAEAERLASKTVAGREHTAHHPVAIVLMRVLGSKTCVSVTARFVHIYNRTRGLDRRIAVIGGLRAFHHAWTEGVASPTSITFPFI